MDTLFVNILNGLSFSSLLFLMAAGFSVTFGLMGILNLSQGGYYMLGAYIGVFVAKQTGNFWLATLVGGVVVGLIGLGMERGFLRHLYKQEFSQALLTFGFVYIFVNVILWIWKGNVKGVDAPPILYGLIEVFGQAYPIYRLFLIIIGLILAIGLWLLQEKTSYGAIIRAGVDNSEMTKVMGINQSLVFAIVFSLGAFLAGFAGVISLPILGAYVESATDVLFLALMVVVIGGMGTLQGAFWGALVIGFIDSLGKAYFPSFAMFTMYLLLLLILLFKPTGLTGGKS
jgi:branched-chain amino acid transport system permease protein